MFKPRLAPAKYVGLVGIPTNRAFLWDVFRANTRQMGG